jgi:hypothetical protein
MTIIEAISPLVNGVKIDDDRWSLKDRLEVAGFSIPDWL